MIGEDKKVREAFLIILLILAICTPLIYATVASMTSWVLGVTLAWVILVLVYVSLARLLKWKY